MADTTPQMTPEIAARMLVAIADGRPLYRACRDNSIAPLVWIKAVGRDPELAAAVREAERAKAELLMAEALEIADTDPDPHRARVRTAQRNFIASRIYREKYGEQPQTVALNVSIAGALQDARARVLNAVKVPELAPAPSDRAEYCDLDATGAPPAFPDPIEAQGETHATRPDKVARDLAELVRLPRTLDDALD